MPKQSSSKNRKPSQHSTRGPRLTAQNADKYDLYERSVQDPDFEVRFIDKAYRRVGRRARSLREDFCGSAVLCARWVESGPDRTATGIDLEPAVLEWGRRRHIQGLGEAAARVRLLEQDVRAPVRARHDVVVALNFSYWVFKTRQAMRDYFSRVRRGLKADGLFILDAYGGWEASEPMLEPRLVKGGFTYVWDQDQFCPITHDVLNHIHFEFKDGTKLQKAFTYDWRFWSLPELRELLLEAGFASVNVYWDDTEDEDEADYRPRKHVGNQPGWLAYLVASPQPERRGQKAVEQLVRRRARRP